MVHSPPPNQRLHTTPSGIRESTFDKLERLTQMSMDGIPGQGYIYDISLGMTYNGSQDGSNALTDTWVTHIQETLMEAIEHSPPNHQLKVLPIDDLEYKKVSLWLSSPEDVRSSIQSYRDLGRYV